MKESPLKSKKNILIVDDSKVIQKLLFAVLSKEPDFEIVGICSDPFEAKEYIANGPIDCMILDLEMPKMDGLTFLKKLMQTHPVKTIILSAAVDSNPHLAEKLLNSGAHAVFSKPNGTDTSFENLKKSIRENRQNLDLNKNHFLKSKPQHLLLIAASTGGTEGVKKILRTLPFQPHLSIIVIQHMAAKFTKTFADSLDKQSDYPVCEASTNEELQAGVAYIAPGNFHIEVLKQQFNTYTIEANQKPHLHSVRPAADVTFLSFPNELIKNSTTIILSGMGKDGADGISYLKKNGSETIAEAESSCVVFGMPKAAIQTGCIDHVLSIDEICTYLQNKFENQNAA